MLETSHYMWNHHIIELFSFAAPFYSTHSLHPPLPSPLSTFLDSFSSQFPSQSISKGSSSLCNIIVCMILCSLFTVCLHFGVFFFIKVSVAAC